MFKHEKTASYLLLVSELFRNRQIKKAATLL